MAHLLEDDCNWVIIGSKELRVGADDVHFDIPSHTEKGLPYSSLTEDDGDMLLSPIADNVEDSRLCVQETTEAMKQLRIVSGSTARVVRASKTIGNAIDTTEKVVNSVKAFLKKWHFVRERLRFVMHALETISEILPYTKLAWDVLSYIPKKISQQIQLDRSIMGLLEAIELSLDLAPDPDALRSRCKQSVNHRKALERLLKQINECGHFIQSYVKDVNIWKRALKNFVKDRKTVIDKYQQALKKLREDFLSETIVTVEMNVFHIIAEVETITESIRDLNIDVQLRELCAVGTKYHPEKGCLPQTRVKFLEAIMKWANDPDPASPMILMLFGQAGTGKSTIAHEVARRFHDMGRLTTSYFFVRRSTSKRESYRLFATLAHDLCSRFPAYKAALAKSIHNNPDVVYAQDYPTLFNSLLRDPLQNIHFVGPVLIVIDALDESEDVTNINPHVGNNGTHFHTFLAKRLSELPSNFRILITSRPEEEIWRAFSDHSSSSFTCMMDDPVLSRGVDNDIFTYLRTRLTGAGVDEDTLWKLARKAEHSFQWASVASHYIANPRRGLSSMQCLRRVLHSTDRGIKGLNPLDDLYTTVLEMFDMEDPDIRDSFQFVMGQIVGAYQPLSITSLNLMNGRAAADWVNSNAPQDVRVIVSHLGSLLSNVTPSNSTNPIAPLHTSFRDFLTDESRSGKFYINLKSAHRHLASATLRIMHQTLRFNICELETSHHLNSEVQDLSKRIEEHIPPVLSYSCRFWVEHLSMVPEIDAELFPWLCAFMEENFLFWLEVLSVEGVVPNATTALLSLRMWLIKIQWKVQNERITTLQKLVNDAIAFVRYFGMPISQSTPHIYLSALPFAPSSSIISKLYSPRFPYTSGLEFGRLAQWPPLQTTISAPDKEDVVCVAFSRDNGYIAAGLDNGSVCVWNALTGMRVCGPLDAHEDQLSDEAAAELHVVPCDMDVDDEEEERNSGVFVSSVVFSHDGRCLATGTSGGMIHIWDVSAGQESVVGSQKRTLKGHRGAVSSLSFSHDDKQLVSGSHDGRVLIWDLENGGVIAGRFTGHHNPVWAVSFLPDREHILTRSGCRTVRVWNVKTGKLVVNQKLFEEMEIPTGIIDSVVHYDNDGSFNQVSRHGRSSFTPCSRFEAVECQEDNLQDNGYYWSQATAFSTDGKLVATSSQNQTHVWYANGRLAGRLAGGPFSNDRVICLAFSTDGKQIVSGSWYGVVRVWNVEFVDEDARESAKEELLVPCSAVFGPDGTRVVVGRQDGTVQMLDTSTGQEVMRIENGDNNREEGWAEVAVSLHGGWISSVCGRELYTWTENGKGVVKHLQHISHGNETINVVFSPDADNILAYCTSSETSTIMVWVFDMSTRAVIAGPKRICDKLGVSCLAISEYLEMDGETPKMLTRVAVGCSQGQTFIWDVNSGDVMGPFTDHRDPVRALVFSGYGTFITSVATDHTICVRNCKTGNIMWRSVEVSHVQKEYYGGYCRNWSVALTQDGQRVAFVGENRTILVFEVERKGNSEIVLQNPLVLAGHLDDVNRMAFSRNGRFLATTSEDYSVRIWDLEAAAHAKHFTHSASETTVNFNEVLIDNDGWATSHGRSHLRLIWIPEIHRESLRRPSNVCVVGRQTQTQLDLRSFFHGKDWVKCKA